MCTYFCRALLLALFTLGLYSNSATAQDSLEELLITSDIVEAVAEETSFDSNAQVMRWTCTCRCRGSSGQDTLQDVPEVTTEAECSAYNGKRCLVRCDHCGRIQYRGTYSYCFFGHEPAPKAGPVTGAH